jgi:hypothetical protein
MTRTAAARTARPTLPPNGVIIYDGPSTLDGTPVVVVLTSLRGTSTNDKTSGGALPLAQTYIIPRAMLPEPDATPTTGARVWFDALAAGSDAAVCGRCPLRPAAVAAARAAGLPAPDPCYVLNGPPDVARAVANGRYPTVDLPTAARYVRSMLAANRIAGVRGGSWGDPAAAPVDVHAALYAAVHETLPDGSRGPRVRYRYADGRSRPAVWTCYTRTWRYRPSIAWAWRTLAMASAHSPGEARDALALGWRPFVVVDGRNEGAVAAAVALVRDDGPTTHCPASAERDTDVTCATCGLCDGAAESVVRHGVETPDPRGAVIIMSHGAANRSAGAKCAAVAALRRMNEARRHRAAERLGLTRP